MLNSRSINDNNIKQKLNHQQRFNEKIIKKASKPDTFYCDLKIEIINVNYAKKKQQNNIYLYDDLPVLSVEHPVYVFAQPLYCPFCF